VEPARQPDVAAAPAIPPIDRFAAFIEVLLCSGFPTQILLIGLLASAGMRIETADGHLSPPFIFTLSLIDSVLVIGLVVFFLRAHRESARRVLLGQRSVLRETLVGIALVPAVFMLVVVILMLLLTVAPQLHNVPRNPLEDMLQTRGNALVFAVVVTVAGGVREEIQRGFILHRFDTFLGGGLVGVLAYSVAFGLGHLQQGYDAAIATSALGAIWGLTYLARRSIVAPMVSHAAFNVAQLIKYVALQ
jgi:membrane protease YdiL (CAAX protease family)